MFRLKYTIFNIKYSIVIFKYLVPDNGGTPSFKVIRRFCKGIRSRNSILDFKSVNEIGQEFADELFRVYANAHPQVELTPTNMTEQVERMWMRAISPRIHK